MTGDGHLWTYRADVVRVVDGDTLDTRIDLGFGVVTSGGEARLRLSGVDTAETYGVRKDSEEYERGAMHARFVKDWLAEGRTGEAWPFLVVTEPGDERGKYGRYLARVVRRSDGAVLNDDLVAEFPSVER